MTGQATMRHKLRQRARAFAFGTASLLIAATAPTMNAHNDFDNPNAVVPATFTRARLANGTLSVTLPAKSVVMPDIK